MSKSFESFLKNLLDSGAQVSAQGDVPPAIQALLDAAAQDMAKREEEAEQEESSSIKDCCSDHLVEHREQILAHIAKGKSLISEIEAELLSRGLQLVDVEDKSLTTEDLTQGGWYLPTPLSEEMAHALLALKVSVYANPKEWSANPHGYTHAVYRQDEVVRTSKLVSEDSPIKFVNGKFYWA